ncbi:MAG: hypothetical protein ABI390_06980 [Daejeonella sp.]
MVTLYDNEVKITLNKLALTGTLFIPYKVNGIIIFCLGRGSSRFSKLTKEMANYFHENNFGTLIFDLLTIEEDKEPINRFDIGLLTERLIGATRWLQSFQAAEDCRLSYFSVDTGAAAAMNASNQIPEIEALVILGGRPDLASKIESQNLKAPTLMVVGSLDKNNVELNKQTFELLNCEKELKIIEDEGKLFEDNGKLELIKEMCNNWFSKYLVDVHTSS